MLSLRCNFFLVSVTRSWRLDAGVTYSVCFCSLVIPLHTHTIYIYLSANNFFKNSFCLSSLLLTNPPQQWTTIEKTCLLFSFAISESDFLPWIPQKSKAKLGFECRVEVRVIIMCLCFFTKLHPLSIIEFSFFTIVNTFACLPHTYLKRKDKNQRHFVDSKQEFDTFCFMFNVRSIQHGNTIYQIIISFKDQNIHFSKHIEKRTT